MDALKYCRWFVLLALASGCSRPLSPAATRLFQDAEKTFAEARSADDYLRAAAMHQAILDRGEISGAVLYNQGNALMKAGQRGCAVAAYRQARRYLPGDPNLEANLTFALGGATAARRPLIEHLLFWQDWVSYPAKFALAALGVAASIVLATLLLFVRRKWLVRLLTASVLASLLLIFSAGYDWRRFDWQRHGVVVQKQTTVRKGNAESYEPALTAPLDEGVEFEVVERRGDWLLVRLPGGQEGWIPDRTAVVY